MTDKHAVALIIVGDEILKGHVQDTNTIYLARSLQKVGVRIRRIVVIPDEVDAIAKEVSEASQNYPVVITAGGVGPTHDDVTYEGVAKGLGLTMKEDEVLLERLHKHFSGEPEAKRLALVPTPCEIVPVKRQDPRGDYWVIKAGNVYVLPGSPCYFQPAVDSIAPLLKSGRRAYTESLDVQLGEFALVALLDSLATRWLGVVSIGSYPQAERRTKIILETEDERALAEVRREILMAVSRFDEAKANRIYGEGLELTHVNQALSVLNDCYNRYGADGVFLSFNGGKDCTVVLLLAAVTLKQRGEDKPPLCLYVTGDAFPEVEQFVNQAEVYYGVEMLRKNGPILRALKETLTERPKLKACLMGTRKCDPGARYLQPFTPTDDGWPDIMRVSPIIDWTYSQVWEFLKSHEVPYCSLYDEGYSSLGSRATTFKNPMLRDPNDPERYLPAHTLIDDSTERQGRNVG